MAGVDKEEFPPLLGLGFWPHDLASLERLCVTAFSLSITRPSVMAGLVEIVHALNHFGLPAEIWVDGSFLTKKLNPDDSDIAVRMHGPVFDSASVVTQTAFRNFIKIDHKPTRKCDLYAFPEYPFGHPLYDYGQYRRAYWLNKFGHSRAEDPKGLAVLTMPFLITP